MNSSLASKSLVTQELWINLEQNILVLLGVLLFEKDNDDEAAF